MAGPSNATVWDLIPSIRRILRGEQREIGVVVIYGIGIGLFSLVVPVAVQSLVNSVAFGTVLQPLVALTVFVFVGMGLSSIMELLQLQVVEYLQRRIYVRVSVDLARRIPLILPDVYRKKFTPQLVNRYLEVFTVQKSIFQILLEGVAVALQTFLGMILLMFYHPYLLVFSLLVISSLVFIYVVLSRGAVRTAIDESDAKYAVVSWLMDIATQPVLFKSTDGTHYALKRSDRVTSHWLNCRESHFKILLREKAAALIIQTFANAGMLAVGGYLVINEQLSLGQLVAAEIVVSLVLSGITKFTKQVEYFYELTAGISKLDSLSDLALELEHGDVLPESAKPIRVNFKGFALHKEGKELLSIPDLELPSGSKVGIFGENGSGKSHLADVLYKLREPGAGSLTFDSANVRDIGLTSLRKEVALIRGAEIFHGTIEENLRLGNDQLTKLQIREALDAVGLSDELDELAQGLDTELTPSGAPLSRGQRYRLVIARMMLRKPRLLVIDESLDSVDDAELDRAFRSLQSKDAPWTLIIFTHELHVLDHFERKLIIEGGRIRELESNHA